MSEKNLTAGLEDYIEAIYIASSENKTIKGVELAKILNISRASVSEALSKLVAKGLIEYKSYGNITLTKSGILQAKKVYAKHNILRTFFETVLGIEPQEAGDNACKIEHIVSQDVLNKIEKLTLYCSENPEVLDKIKNHLTL